MTEQRRSEMRSYRDLAVIREKELQMNRKKLQHSTMNNVEMLSIQSVGATTLPGGDNQSVECASDGVAAKTSYDPGPSFVPHEVSSVSGPSMPLDWACSVRKICLGQSDEAVAGHTQPNNVRDTQSADAECIPTESELEISIQSCTSNHIDAASGYASDDSNLRRCSSSSAALFDDYTTEDQASNVNSLADAKVYSSISMSSLSTFRPDDPIHDGDGRTNANQSVQSRPTFIRSKSYTIDSPSPHLLKHIQEKGLDQEQTAAAAVVANEKQDKEDNEKIRPPPVVLRVSKDATSGPARKIKQQIASKKMTESIGAPNRRLKAIERVYGQRMNQPHPSATSSFAPKTAAVGQRKTGLIINGLSLEGVNVTAKSDVNCH